MDYLKSIAPGKIVERVRMDWKAVYIWIACNSAGTDEPFFGNKELRFQKRGGPIRVITEEDLDRFGIDSDLYRGLAQSIDGKIYLPTTDKVKASQWTGKLRDLFETFISIPARPNSLGLKRLAPFGSKNLLESGFIAREFTSNLRKMKEGDPDDTFKDNQAPDGTTLKGKSYRRLFNENGGQKFILPPFNHDYRVASDRVMQLKNFRDSRMPLIETLTQASHTCTLEFKEASNYSAEVGVSSKGLVHVVLHTPNGGEASRPVVNKNKTIGILQEYVNYILKKQENIAEKAETKA